VLGTASFAAFWLLAAAAGAAIVSTSGAASQIPAPPSVELGALESNTTIFAFDEQQGVALAADVNVDISAPGVYDELADLTPSVIAAGTKVSSHLLHADRVGRKASPLFLDGSVTFDQEVVGLAILGGTLDASDVLGAPGTIYPNGKFRKLSPDAQEDSVTLSDDKKTVTVHLQLKRHSDQIRVITADSRCRKEDEDDSTSTDDDTKDDSSDGDDSSGDGGSTKDSDSGHDMGGGDSSGSGDTGSHGDTTGTKDTTGDDTTGTKDTDTDTKDTDTGGGDTCKTGDTTDGDSSHDDDTDDTHDDTDDTGDTSHDY
jgi:hypothetical protein